MYSFDGLNMVLTLSTTVRHKRVSNIFTCIEKNMNVGKTSYEYILYNLHDSLSLVDRDR